MAIQVVPNQQSFGASLGSSLGSGLGQGLSMLAQHKINQIQDEKKAKAWESIGLEPEMAHFIVQSPEWLQKELVRRLEGFGQGQKRTTMAQTTSDSSKIPVDLSSTIKKTPKLTVGMSKEDKKRAHEDQKVITKEVLPYIKDVQNKAKGARENNVRLNRMEKLIESGKLNNPAFASVLKTLKTGVGGIFGHVGLDLTSLLSPESQEFEKISADFVKNAKDIFGNRVTDTDLKAFLATIPNLSQTNEGKRAVIHNLKLMNDAAELREKAARELLKHYDNRPPLDFEAQVDDLIKPELDAIAQQIQQGVKTKSAKTSTLPGDLVGGIGQLGLGNA